MSNRTFERTMPVAEHQTFVDALREFLGLEPLYDRRNVWRPRKGIPVDSRTYSFSPFDGRQA